MTPGRQFCLELKGFGCLNCISMGKESGLVWQARVVWQEGAGLVVGKELVLWDLERSGRVFFGQSVNHTLLTGLQNIRLSFQGCVKLTWLLPGC